HARRRRRDSDGHGGRVDHDSRQQVGTCAERRAHAVRRAAGCRLAGSHEISGRAAALTTDVGLDATPASPAALEATSSVGTLLISSSIGSLIEWYDFFVFASAAVLVFDRVFFPAVDPLNGVLLSLMTYAVGFVTRPAGGLVFGVLGDRFGRKRILIWSLMLMGVATMGVGLLPGYASIGIAAPALLVLLRLIQGFAVGGEVGGALLLVAESLPAERRGYWTAWPMIGGPAGNVLSAAVLAVLGVSLGDAALADWGWRVAFLASGLLIGVGIWMRTRVAESPLYLAYA